MAAGRGLTLLSTATAALSQPGRQRPHCATWANTALRIHRPEHIFQLTHPQLRRVPSAEVLGCVPNNLPIQITTSSAAT